MECVWQSQEHVKEDPSTYADNNKDVAAMAMSLKVICHHKMSISL